MGISSLNEQMLLRLHSALDALGLKRHGRGVEVAEKTGYSRGQVSGLLSGKVELNDRFIKSVCQTFSISEAFIRSGKEPMVAVSQGERPINRPEGTIPIREIPVLGRISAGFPNLAVQEVIEYIAIPGTPENSFALVVRGSSMEPSFRDGDYVIFIENGDYRHNDVLIVLDEWGEAMVKRLKEKEGRRYLVSDNPAYPVVVPNENFRIIGKVVKGWRDIKF